MIDPINIIVWCAAIFLVVMVIMMFITIGLFIRLIVIEYKETKRAKNHADWLASTGRYRKGR